MGLMTVTAEAFVPGGTRLRQRAQVGPGPSGLTVAIAAMPRHAAVVVDMSERATPLAQKFFDAASEWLRRQNI